MTHCKYVIYSLIKLIFQAYFKHIVWTDNTAHPRYTREGVQSIHEPRKLTSGAFWFAEWFPSQLLANQNRLQASCYVWQAAQLSLTSSNSISIWLLHPPKAFFPKNLNMFIKFLMVHKQFVLKSLSLIEIKTSYFVFLNFTNS